MQAYFRMNDSIFDSPVARALAKTSKGDSGGPLRVMMLIRILNAALYPSKCFTDASALVGYFGVSEKQAQKVWDTCIEYRVLRPAGYGFSAREWLVDNGYLGRYERDGNRTFEEGMRC